MDETEGTKAILKELIKVVSQIYREAGDLLSDTADLSQIIGSKEAKFKFRQGLRYATNRCTMTADELVGLRKTIAKAKSATATQLEIDIFDE